MEGSQKDFKEKNNIDKAPELSTENKRSWLNFRYGLFRMVSVGVVDEPINQAYDVISTGALIINLTATLMNTFNYMSDRYGTILSRIEFWTVAIFAIDYILRIITAPPES